MARKGINSTHSIYYGRKRGFKRRLTIFLLALLLVGMALAAGFFYLQEYIVYTADGFRFDFPFLKPDNQPESPQPEQLPEQIPLVTDDEKDEKASKGKGRSSSRRTSRNSRLPKAWGPIGPPVSWPRWGTPPIEPC